ncbi:MAG: pyruvate, phosphate dikinase [Alphaproteobacteria bacterium]|nr:pyruvate, phosphate dikinase [Alphaproteobacteria bacterium]
MSKWVYAFGGGTAEGDAKMNGLLGGKGANLAEMASLGLPVPPGFTLTTEVCTHYYANGRTYPDDLKAAVEAALHAVEDAVGARFGDAANPLLVSVRSGARASMPGMMDTVLNLGLNEETVAGLAAASGDERFAWDSYRRFIQMYGGVVLDLEHDRFEELLAFAKEDAGYGFDTDMSADDWRELVAEYKDMVAQETGSPFPDDPREQLWGAIGAVFSSWMNPRAVTYRRLHDIPADWGTAVNVQAMVFGNMGDDCATGVAFTRDPATGEDAFYGEFLVNAQGEDVVGGIRTPQPLSRAAREAGNGRLPSMEEILPQVYGELVGIRETLETHYRDMQDIEFTVQKGRLWMLQTRTGKRTAHAAIRIAVDLVAEGLIDRREAIARIDPQTLDQLLHPMISPDAEREVLATGLPASPGAASGRIAFNADDAETRAARGEKVILVRTETSPDDIHGMHAAAGIVTARGGMTSHAAVVARGMGRACVAGAGDLAVDAEAGTLRVAGRTLGTGDEITIDGATGEIMAGALVMVQPTLGGEFGTLMDWADEFRRLRIRTNAETPGDVKAARDFGAEGIGLSRTEHMFFDDDRIAAMREMILADSVDGRRAALAKLQPMQEADFEEIFRLMAGLPVTIRLLDPPLHEFLPKTAEEFAQLAADTGTTPEAVARRVSQLHETNPMLGHRGCRLGITYPEIYEMQARAIFNAAARVNAEAPGTACPEVMIPLIATRAEFDALKPMIDTAAKEAMKATGTTFDYLVGTMIELPRAALMAREIAESAEFFSYGTNDLTQTTFGLSRDDSGRFLDAYRGQGILPADPFVSIDEAGVGELIRIATERGRAARPGIKLGICGEHGGDPASIRFCEAVGLDYVSCSPFRVPVARLAAAQAAIAAAPAED